MTVRVGTWNVEYARGVERNAQRLALLQARDADVWVLTETHDDLDLSATHEPHHSDQRYPAPGGRWTTVWSRFPLVERLDVADPSRCVAVRLDAGSAGELVVYGTVLPWHSETGPDPERPARSWAEFMRVVPLQAAEWRSLRSRFPRAGLVVAGDLNHDLGGPHYYGTKAGRALLAEQLASADLACLTLTSAFAAGELAHPPIDHVCAGPEVSAVVEGWDNVVDGVRLSDHGGTLAAIDLP